MGAIGLRVGSRNAGGLLDPIEGESTLCGGLAMVVDETGDEELSRSAPLSG